MKSNRILFRTLVSLGLPALLVLAFGCGLDQVPVAQEEETLAPAAKRVVTAVTTSSTEATATSSDGTGRLLYTKTVSGSFAPNQAGALEVKFSNSYGDWSDLRLSKALFAVKAGSLSAAQVITMSVTTGYVLEDLKVDFGPDGLSFTPPATLTLTIWWGCESCRSEEQLAILQALAQHIHPDSAVTEMAIQTDRQGNAYLIVTIDVPGFSRYGLAQYGN